MPRIASNNKQKNKKFKGTTKNSKKAYIKPKTKVKTKGIIKVKSNPKSLKLQRLKDLKEKK